MGGSEDFPFVRERCAPFAFCGWDQRRFRGTAVVRVFGYLGFSDVCDGGLVVYWFSVS